jgi:cytochrome c5
VSNADNIFWRRFGAILLALTVFGVVVAFIARDIAGDSFRTAMNNPAAVAERLAQDGTVRVGDPDKVVDAAPKQTAMAPAAAPAAASGGDDGESVYNAACVACHQAGVAGAPKLGDETAWAERIASGEDALVASVVKGKGAMPPKGGNASLSEAQIKAAVAYMVEKSSPGGAAAAMPKMAKEAAAEAGKAAEKVMEKASDMAEKAKDKAADMATKATEEVAAAASTAMAAATPAASGGGKPGDEVYNMGCVACHATGAANAPKLTDKAAWDTRMAGGLDALIDSAIKGKGAMPPKGGLVTLSDDDIANAVRYMLKEAGVGGGG